ncbi:MAG: hypothetical protein Q7R83_02990 [bacterium]|nr:hypothetical protein [bacterium]
MENHDRALEAARSRVFKIAARALGIPRQDVQWTHVLDERHPEVAAVIQGISEVHRAMLGDLTVSGLIGYLVDQEQIRETLHPLSLDDAVRASWQRQLEEAAASGWYCTIDPEETRQALDALRAGKEVLSFPRSG